MFKKYRFKKNLSQPWMILGLLFVRSLMCLRHSYPMVAVNWLWPRGLAVSPSNEASTGTGFDSHNVWTFPSLYFQIWVICVLDIFVICGSPKECLYLSNSLLLRMEDVKKTPLPSDEFQWTFAPWSTSLYGPWCVCHASKWVKVCEPRRYKCAFFVIFRC